MIVEERNQMNEKLGSAGRASHRMVANKAKVTLEASRRESQTCRKGGVYVYACAHKSRGSLWRGKIEHPVDFKFHRQIAGTRAGLPQG